MELFQKTDIEYMTDLRAKSGLTQTAFGSLIGVKKQQISNWEKKGGFSFAVFLRLCEAVKTKISVDLIKSD